MPDDARDIDQPATQLDDEVLGDEYPPERPLGLDEGLDDQEAEDFGDEPGWNDDDAEGEIEIGVGFDGDDEELNVPVVEDDPIGALADDDEFTGDETTRDVATERVPPPAEEQAIHVEPDNRQSNR